MDDEELIDEAAIEGVLDDEEDLDEEDLDEEDLDEEDLDEEVLDDDLAGDDLVDGAEAVSDAEEEDADAVPAARRRPRAEDDEEEEEDIDPDDVEADLDTILKERVASSDDEEEDEEVEADAPGDAERVPAKTADEFTCETCFMIVHPRQFGRLGGLRCPEGYDPCGSMSKVEAMLKKAAKQR
jgi:hypothetical protein